MGSVDFEEIKKRVQSAWRGQSAWREAARDDFDFENGHQWSDEEKRLMDQSARVPIVFNRCAPIIAAVAGTEINNRTEVRFIPREIGDAKPNEVLTAGAEWFRDAADAEDTESEAFRDLLVCGLGVTETALDFEADDEGAPKIYHVDPLEFFWDTHAHRKGLQDARMLGRVRKMPRDAAREMFPDNDETDLDADWLNKSDDDDAHVTVIGDQYRFGDGSMEDAETEADTVTIVQVQWCEKAHVVEFISNGQRREWPKDAWNRAIKAMADIPPHRTKSKIVWRQAFLGKTVLRENQPNADAPTIRVMTGHWDRKDKRFYGLLRMMRDPQKYANKWLSQLQHIINTNAKGGVIVEEGAVENFADFEDNWAAADAVHWVKNGGLQKIKEKSGVQMPAALMQLTEFAISSIRDVTGVNLEIMGMREANQPGILEYQRRQSGMTILAVFFDSLRFYRKGQGEVILYFLRHHIAPTGRLVRILRNGLEQYVPLALDDDTRKYDVIVDDAPSSPNEKERAWSVIEAMMPMLQSAGLSLNDWADILEYSPLPSSFVEKVRERAATMQQQPDPVQQLGMAREQAEIEETQSKTVLNQARAQELGVKAVTAAAQPPAPQMRVV